MDIQKEMKSRSNYLNTLIQTLSRIQNEQDDEFKEQLLAKKNENNSDQPIKTKEKPKELTLEEKYQLIQK